MPGMPPPPSWHGINQALVRARYAATTLSVVSTMACVWVSISTLTLSPTEMPPKTVTRSVSGIK